MVFAWYSQSTLKNILLGDINHRSFTGLCLRSMWQRIRNIQKFSLALGCSPVSIKQTDKCVGSADCAEKKIQHSVMWIIVARSQFYDSAWSWTIKTFQ